MKDLLNMMKKQKKKSKDKNEELEQEIRENEQEVKDYVETVRGHLKEQEYFKDQRKTWEEKED